MKPELIQSFLLKNGECFDPFQLSGIQASLSEIDDAKSALILGMDFQKPTVMLIIAIVLGWERFFLNDIAMGVLKVITCYGCGIWWVIDIFTAVSRTKTYNMNKLNAAILLCK